MSEYRSADHRFLSPAPTSEPLIDDRDTGPQACLPTVLIHLPRRTPHDGRSGRLSAGGEAEVAKRYAEQTLRLVFEVLERRRPSDQLRGRLEPKLIDMVRTRTATHGQRPIALTGLVRVQLIRRGSAEFFARYSDGTRIGAVAGHLIWRRGGWRVDALRIG